MPKTPSLTHRRRHGVSPPTEEGLGRVLCPSAEMFVFGYKWAIFVQFFLHSGKSGGGALPSAPPH